MQAPNAPGRSASSLPGLVRTLLHRSDARTFLAFSKGKGNG